MALPIYPDDAWDSEAMPEADAEDESAAHGISDTQWTTSIWSAADKSTGKKTHAINDRRNLHHLEANRVRVTDQDSRRICREIDRRILLILIWAYFLQVLLQDPDHT